jgi:NitT/TauT family transport system substrate-binding protein
MRERSVPTVALVACLAVVLAGCSTAKRPTAANTEGPLAPVRIGVGGIQKVIYGPAKLAEQLGYFKAEGLTVDLQDEVSGGPSQDNEVLVGHLDGVVGFMDHSVVLQAQAKCVESVVQFANVPLEKVMVRSADADKIKTPADWRGKGVGFTSLGSSTDGLMQALAAKAGVTRADYTPAPVKDGSTFINALEKGDIVVGMTTPPTSTLLLKKGTGKVLIDLSTVEGTKKELGGLYPASSLYMSCEWADAHPREVQGLANALVKTLRWIKAHSAAEIVDKMPADYAAAGEDVYLKSWEETKDGFTTDGVIDVDGLNTVLDIQALVKPDVATNRKSIKLSDCYTTEFVKKVPAE